MSNSDFCSVCECSSQRLNPSGMCSTCESQADSCVQCGGEITTNNLLFCSSCGGDTGCENVEIPVALCHNCGGPIAPEDIGKTDYCSLQCCNIHAAGYL